METINKIVGLPWQLAEEILLANHYEYETFVGENFNRFFEISEGGFYVARVKQSEDKKWQILLYKPMVMSEFNQSKEVKYAKFLFEGEK